MSTQDEIKEALRRLHTAAPEAALLIERHTELLEAQIALYTSEDAFRAFVLSLAQQFGHTQALLQRLDATVMADLARSDADAKELSLLREKARHEKETTVRHVLSQPVVLGLVGIVSTIMTALATILIRISGAAG
jgi:hypothetical protein